MNKVPGFKRIIWNYYQHYRRDFPWRETTDPYYILVSEVMLQQTQTHRVVSKYETFIKKFPTCESLANAANMDVLQYWSGLGYNRRALYLKRTAERITREFDGKLPDNPEVLETFPGIGKATAASIVVFAFNKPQVFIETNIRRVFIHHFFTDSNSVSDKKILPLIEKTIDKKDPREWYYALMDYGAHLPKLVANPNRRSKHYTKQSTFEGSIRQVRGRILKELADKEKLNISLLYARFEKEKVDKAIAGLEKDGFILTKNSCLQLKV